MKKLYGLKASFTLIALRIVSLILTLITVGIPVLVYLDYTNAPMTDDEKVKLTETISFRKAVKMAYRMVSDPSQYGNLDDVTLIEYSDISYRAKYPNTGNYSYKLIRIKSSKSETYIDVEENYVKITADNYADYTKSQGRMEYSNDSKIFIPSELKVIKDFAKSDNIKETIRSWDREEMEKIDTFNSLKKLLTSTDPMSTNPIDYLDDITYITCTEINKVPQMVDAVVYVDGLDKPLKYRISALYGVQEYENVISTGSNTVKYRGERLAMAINAIWGDWRF